MSKYLVTGGAGFIGSHLVDTLITAGHEVSILDNMHTGKAVNMNHKANIYIGSVTDRSRVSDTMHNVDGVYHLAAISSVPYSIEHPLEVNNVNVGGTLMVLDVARELDVPVIFASSASVYGECDTIKKGETDTPKPLSTYAVSKLAGEQYCEMYARSHDMRITVLRFFNVYGPRQNPHGGYAGAIASFCKAMVDEEQPIVYGDGSQSRDFIFVHDVVRGLILSMSHVKKGFCHVMNLGTGDSVNLLDVIETLGTMCPILKPARIGDVHKSQAHMQRTHFQLGFETETSLKDGLAQTYDWFQNNE